MKSSLKKRMHIKTLHRNCPLPGLAWIKTEIKILFRQHTLFCAPLHHQDNRIIDIYQQTRVISSLINRSGVHLRSHNLCLPIVMLTWNGLSLFPKNSHCVKSVFIRSYFGLHFPVSGRNTERYGVCAHAYINLIFDFFLNSAYSIISLHLAFPSVHLL